MNNSQINLSEVEGFLKGKFGNNIQDVQVLGGGAWSYAYSYVLNEIKYVIRWGNVPDNFERDTFASRFSSPLMPVPKIEEMGEENSRYYAVSRFYSGDFLEEISASELDGAKLSINKMLHSIRSIDLSSYQGFGFFNKEGVGSHSSWREFILDDKNESQGSLIHGWKTILAASSMGNYAYYKIWNEFKSLVNYCPEDKRMVHSDLVNKNVLVESNNISAVLDWGSAFYGDPLYDIACIKFCEIWYPSFKETNLVEYLLNDFKSDSNVNIQDIEERLLCYQLNIGANAIAYNAFRREWKNAEIAADYALKMI